MAFGLQINDSSGNIRLDTDSVVILLVAVLNNCNILSSGSTTVSGVNSTDYFGVSIAAGVHVTITTDLVSWTALSGSVSVYTDILIFKRG
jgi:hypothetical protein